MEVTGNFDTKVKNTAEDPETITICVYKDKEREAQDGVINLYFDQWSEIVQAVDLIVPHWKVYR